MNDTLTPETDAVASPHIGFYSCATVPANLARKLERERDEARFDLDFRRELFKLQSNTLKSITKQRDRLAEALRSIKNELGVPQPEYPSPVANAVKIANEALKYLNPET